MNTEKVKKIVIIGSGFAGLSAACYLSQEGHDVTVLEKNDQSGGRARVWYKDGFTFDMGPSWYWMPEVFEQFFCHFGATTADFYDLKRLDPSYRINYSGNEFINVPASIEEIKRIFEQKEKGSAKKLAIFLSDAEYKYKAAMSDYVERISDSIAEFFDIRLISKSFQLRLLQSLRSEVRTKFKHPHLVSLLEFPSLFLGSTPDHTPAMYTMMNYTDLVLGTWYPMGGMNRIVQAMTKIATDNRAKILLDQEVIKIEIKKGKVKQVHTKLKAFEADIVIAGSDYHHTEQKLLEPQYRSYDEKYWNSRVMSPSSLIFYLGVSKRLPNLLHHNLFFDEDFETHAREIYHQPSWPTAPLFYVSAPSVTDPTVAPFGMENLFLLMPLAPGIPDSDEMREKYFKIMMYRLQKKIGKQFEKDIVVKRSFCLSDFEKDYNSFKGNAYGLANILSQTAIWKPKMKSPKVSNLLYTGQLTVPGPGVPPSIISGRMAAKEVRRQINEKLI
jgi:phytoene desaturase